MKSSRMLTPAQVAERLGIPVATLKAWRYKGIGPVFSRMGKHVRYDEADVEAYISETRVTA